MVSNGIEGEFKEEHDDIGIMPKIDQMLVKPIAESQKVYCTKDSLMCFGETMTNGKLTLNAQDLFKSYNLPLPELPLMNKGWWTNQKRQLVRVTESNGARHYKRFRHHTDPVEKCFVIARRIKNVLSGKRA